MKRFQEFTENIDKVAALKAKQRTAVHSGDVDTENLIAKKQAKAKAMARKAEIRAEIQNEKQDK